MTRTQINLADRESDGAGTGEEPRSFANARGALLELLSYLRGEQYDFMAPTPASHAHVVARNAGAVGSTIADLLGWSLPCRSDALPSAVLSLLDRAGQLDHLEDGTVQARIRVSEVFGNLFVHSRYPTQAKNSVFLGPDSHRFGDFILRNLDGVRSSGRILDYGAGAGVGGITAATYLGKDAVLTLADINPDALELASINAEAAGIEHDRARVETPAEVIPGYDLIVTHPPFMIDPDRRAYRDGGELYGGKLSLDWTLALLPKLASGGRFVMHTGVSIVGGRDVVREALREAMPATGYSYEYRVLDPDIFGEELATPAYADVDRIAAIGLSVTRDRYVLHGQG